MIPELRFDPEAHRYFLGGKEIPGVTNVLNKVGLISDFAKSETAALRGQLVHKACYYLAQGNLAWPSVDDRIVGYVLAYKKFLDDTGFEPEALEERRFHPEYLYAGTLDCRGSMRKFPKLIVDLKSGAPAKSHAIQLAAYSGFFGGTYKRATLLLHNDGKYSLRFHDDRSDWNNWLACLAVARLREAM